MIRVRVKLRVRVRVKMRVKVRIKLKRILGAFPGIDTFSVTIELQVVQVLAEAQSEVQV